MRKMFIDVIKGREHRLNNWSEIYHARAEIASQYTHMSNARSGRQDLIFWVISYSITLVLFAVMAFIVRASGQ